jgi:pimeloyl-ACP methyl ester carboxylesterase
LATPSKAAFALLFVAFAGWNGVFSSGDHFFTSLFRPMIGPYWRGLTSVLMIGVTAATVFFLRSADTQKQAAMIIDVLGFWPRAYHPYSPPAYPELTLERLTQAVRRMAAGGASLFLIGHSQGSVLSYCATWRLDPEVRSAVNLITCGSPLKSLYARVFPRYFSSEEFDRGAQRLPSWHNLHRDTDPIASAIFKTHDGDSPLIELEPAVKLHKHSDYWEDPAMIDLVVGADTSVRIK